MKTYDKQRLIQNLYYYIKTTNAKVGDLESAANVSTGYLSRWKNDGNEASSPTVETLSIMADKLGVSLDILLFTDVESLNASERKIVDYINRFIKKTESEDFQWEKITVNQAYNAYQGGFGESVGPLPFMIDVSRDFNNVVLEYKSLFDDNGFRLHSPIYRLVGKTSTIYITCIVKSGNTLIQEIQYEMYLDSGKNGLSKICNYDKTTNSELGKVIKDFYDLIEITSRSRLDDKVVNELDSFFKEDDDGGLGF